MVIWKGVGVSPVHAAHDYVNHDIGEVPVILTELLDGSTGYYGISGGIPGALTETDLSAVVLSWLSFAGRDGIIDEEGALLMGETLAHEVGHYSGLFHPVEDGFRYWDALDDTDECRNRSECETQLGENFMFPYSICDFTSCVRAVDVTDDQAGVMNNYTGVQ